MPNPPENPTATDSLCDRSATELLALLEGKHASAEEVVRAHIDRIERVNPALNAVGGGSCLGLGTDIGGSSRVPAAFCGIVGFKPTAGRLPDHGRFSFSPGQQAIGSQVGVLGRTVGDVALGLTVANGTGPGARPMPDHARCEIRGLRIAMYTDDGFFTPCPAAKRAVLEAADALTLAGAEIVEWTPPDLGEAAALAFWLLAHDGGRGLRDALHGSRKDPRVKQMLALGRLPNRALSLARGLLGATGQKSLAEATRLFAPPGKGRTGDYWRLTDARDAYAARFQDRLGSCSVVLSPAVALPALRHGASKDLGVMGSYTILWNLLGWPAGVVPWTKVAADEETVRTPTRDVVLKAARNTELGSAGLPIGVQLSARPWNDHVVLAAMSAVERARQVLASNRPDSIANNVAPARVDTRALA